MRRFLATLVLAFSILIAPTSVATQPVQGKLVRIGVLGNEWWPPVEGLPEKLRSLGYVEGVHFPNEHPVGRKEEMSAIGFRLPNWSRSLLM